ncbi:MAG: GNAT family N-acetyltransferase [Polyangiaceae bacterium]
MALGPSPVVFGEDDLDVGELAAVLGTKLLERTRDLGCRLLSFRADCKELGISWGFQRAGFVVADTNVQFRMHITDELLEPLRAPGQCCSAALPEDREAVLAMARIFRSDHFHADQRVPRQRADDLYAQWVDNSLTGRADEVLVVRDEGTAIGFITCRLFSERGVIELVGASPSSRGRGVGLALVAGAVSWFHRHGATVVDVGTQVSNVAACRVYQRAGFASVAYGNTFHGWADD